MTRMRERPRQFSAIDYCRETSLPPGEWLEAKATRKQWESYGLEVGLFES
jgi:hypothetical protein